MADANDVVYITQCELQEFVGQYGSGIGESKQRMVCEHCAQPHGPRMEDSLLAETAQTRMAVDNLDLLADDDVAEYREEGEDSRHRRFAVNDEERDVVDLQSIGEVAHPGSSLVRMGDDDDFMAAVDELLEDDEY